MSDLERHQPTTGTLAPTPPVTTTHDGAAAIIQWAEAATAAHQLATNLAATPFAGSWKGDPAGATAAILKGSEVGLSPLAALAAFDNIQGKPAASALTLRALVQAQGHTLELVESTPARCVMRGRRKGATDWTTVEWTIERAQALGLAGKDQWKRQPQTMLTARATSELARLIAADVILGIGYSAEEVRDMPTDDTPPTKGLAAALTPPPAVDTATGELDPTLDPTWETRNADNA